MAGGFPEALRGRNTAGQVQLVYVQVSKNTFIEIQSANAERPASSPEAAQQPAANPTIGGRGGRPGPQSHPLFFAEHQGLSIARIVGANPSIEGGRVELAADGVVDPWRGCKPCETNG